MCIISNICIMHPCLKYPIKENYSECCLFALGCDYIVSRKKLCDVTVHIL